MELAPHHQGENEEHYNDGFVDIPRISAMRDACFQQYPSTKNTNSVIFINFESVVSL